MDRIITELAVFDVEKGRGLILVELAEGVSMDQIKAVTTARFKIHRSLIPTTK